jgi:beta-lactamase superfamily II metal-dependent hydrolase
MRQLVRLFSVLALLLWATAASAADLTVYFFDVGQGDGMLIVSPAGKTVLIDAGPSDAGEAVARRLKQILTAPIDLMLMTHPHADHLGGMEKALNAVGASLFMEPGFSHPSAGYNNLLKALEEKKVPLKLAEAGRNINLGGGANLHLLAPTKPFFHGTRSDVNSNSVVARLTYGDTAFYFAADSEDETERAILASGEDLKSNVYKVAHHGGRHSTSADLLAKIKPEIAVISVGANNDYGHPTRQAMDRMEAVHARILRTDLDGEIVIKSDGKKVTVSTGANAEAGGSNAGQEPVVVAAKAEKPEKKPVEIKVEKPDRAPARDDDMKPEKPSKAASKASASEGGYLSSKNSQVFHKADCRNGQKIKAENQVSFKTREEAVEAGKRPAKDCNP